MLIYVYGCTYIIKLYYFIPFRSARLNCVEIDHKILVIAATNVKCMQFRFSAAILDFQLNGTVYKIADTIIKKLDPENMGMDARITFLSALDQEI